MQKLFKPLLQLNYFFIAIFLLIVEVLIALLSSGWARNYLGDVIVVMLLYTLLMSLFKLNKTLAMLITLLLAYVVEIFQYFNVVELLSFAPGSIGYIVLGNTFSLMDLFCYSIGCLLILFFEYLFGHYKSLTAL